MAVDTQAAQPGGDSVGPSSGRWRPKALAVVVLVVGLAATAGGTVASEIGYRHNEHRLLTLQTGLTGALLRTAPADFTATLGRVVGLAAESSDPVATFKQAFASELAPKGPFASGSLVLVHAGTVQVLEHVGTPALSDLSGAAARAVFARAAGSKALITTRLVAHGTQKLGYLLSATGPGGTYVLSASQELKVAQYVTVPASSPDANLHIALYFGRSTSRADLVETNVHHLPLTGITATTSVPFGTSVLTLVASPKGTLGGSWAEFLPWGILVVGALFTLLVAVLTDRLVRTRASAEASAALHQDLYRRQRGVSETLQRALLPKGLPAVDGAELAARYLPSTRDAEVGGDWYSVVPVDDHRFLFVVGDVSGHGIPAAGLMAALRYTIRTLARLDFDPAEILNRAHGEIDIGTDGHFATALVGVVDTAADTVTLASAGHLPPLVVGPDGSSYPELVVGVPLGVAGARAVSVTWPLPAGSTLVAFTDGLVEHRDRSLDVGFEELAAAAGGPAASVEARLERIIDQMSGGGNEDDIAVLAVHRVPSTVSAPPSVPASVRS